MGGLHLLAHRQAVATISHLQDCPDKNDSQAGPAPLPAATSDPAASPAPTIHLLVSAQQHNLLLQLLNS